MDASRRPPHKRNRVLTIAIVASVAVHLAALPFLRVAAIAHAKSQPPEILLLDPARPTPKPFVPPPPTPRPRIVHAPPPSQHVSHVVAIVPPRAHTQTANAPAETHAALPARPGEAPRTGAIGSPNHGPGDAGLSSGEPVAPPAATQPAIEATIAPVETPACAAASHEAHVLEAVTPERPAIAAEEGATGRVEVRVDLAATGLVTSASVYKSSGYAALDSAAVDAARHATYAPASDGCHPIAGSYIYTVDYSE